MTTTSDSTWSNPLAQRLASALVAIDSADTMQNFLRDILTKKEIIEISARLEAARLLRDGATYAKVTRQTQLSSRTVARISDWMQNGTGGYAVALDATRPAVHHDHLPPAHAA